MKSRFVQFTGSIFLIFLLFFLGQKLYKKYQINQEIAQLQEEIARLQSKNQDILKVIEYLKTAEYKERQARSLLGLQKEGEFAVALPGGEEEQIAGSQTNQSQNTSSSNFVKWWHYFFSKNK